jgi:SagB-type dehydrogenase family enzyme
VDDAVAAVLSYHLRSCHHPGRFAPGPGYLDWATQPDPFRTYAGAPVVELPLAADALATPYADLYRPGGAPVRPVDLESVAILFELALGLSAWKSYLGERWALRCNPSSGNLHPTEGYAVLPDLPGLPAGVYHYVSRDHALERRCDPAAGITEALGSRSFLVGLTSVHWREAWKYGERAFRYCQHDAGHAIATVRYAAAALGWSARLLAGAGDADLAALLGLDRDGDFAGLSPLDRECPDAALLLTPGATADADGADLVARLAAVAREGAWAGRANALSPDHARWAAIDAAAAATAAGPAAEAPEPAAPLPPPGATAADVRAATLIRRRRSCLALDGTTSIDAASFYAMLDRLLPRPGVPPWDALPWAPRLHPALFVHRVRGLASGLYLLERSEAVHAALRAATRPEFRWTRPEDCPEHLRLFLLAPGDFRTTAEIVACRQEIAADGAFSLGMIAEFGETIRARGPRWYRRLHWEAGVLGQVLYLEAEAAGVRGTGIGCFFDDLMHEVLGLADDRFRTLYHFTLGGPVDDPRLETSAPYAHLGPRTWRPGTGP